MLVKAGCELPWFGVCHCKVFVFGKIAGWTTVLVLVLVLKQILHEGSGRMAKLSVVIITENEEKFIADAVNCVSFADEVLVVDCGSTDKTCDIAEELGARVAHQGWLGF